MLKRLWNKVDGKKRTIGIIAIIIGYILKQFPELDVLSKSLIDAGIIISGIGVGHSIKKERNSKRKIGG